MSLLIGKTCTFSEGDKCFDGIVLDKIYEQNHTFYLISTDMFIKVVSCHNIINVYDDNGSVIMYRPNKD